MSETEKKEKEKEYTAPVFCCLHSGYFHYCKILKNNKKYTLLYLGKMLIQTSAKPSFGLTKTL